MTATAAFRPTTAAQIKPGNTIFFSQLGVGILCEVTYVEKCLDRDGCDAVRLTDTQGSKQLLEAEMEVFVRY